MFLQFRTIIFITILFLGIYGCAKPGGVLSFSEPFSGSGTVSGATGGAVSPAPSLNYAVTVLAGSSGVGGYQDGVGTSARFRTPYGIAYSKRDQVLYVADAPDYAPDSGHAIRRISLSAGNQTDTIAGGGSLSYSRFVAYTPGVLSLKLQDMRGLALKPNPSGSLVQLYVVETRLQTLFEYNSAQGIKTIAGEGLNNSIDGAFLANSPAALASFNVPNGVAFDANGDVFVAESRGIRKVWLSSPANGVTTVASYDAASSAGDSDGQTCLRGEIWGLAVSKANNNWLYFSNLSFGLVCRLDLSSHTINLIWDTQRTAAPVGLASDESGNIFAVDFYFNSIYVISPSGQHFKLQLDRPGDLNSPFFLDVDEHQNLYVSNLLNKVILKLTPVP